MRGIAGDWASPARTAVPKPQQYVYAEIEPREAVEKLKIALPQTSCADILFNISERRFKYEIRSDELRRICGLS